jgi:hypothetical protein
MRLVNRYLPRLKGIHRAKLRHVIFTYGWIDADFEKTADWLMIQVRVLYRLLKWEGMVASVELKEKFGSSFYIHVHAVACCQQVRLF